MLFPELSDVRALRGPNVWARCAVLQAGMRAPAGAMEDASGFASRLRRRAAPLGPSAEAGVSAAEYWAHTGDGRGLALALAQLTIAIQVAATCKVALCSVAPSSTLDSFSMAMEIESLEDAGIGREALATAHVLCRSAFEHSRFDFDLELERLKELGGDVLLGPNTRAIADAAKRRGIPVRRLDQGSLLQLGHGIHQRRMCGAETDHTSSIGEDIGWEKPLSKELLTAVGVPTPEGRTVTDAEDAWRAAGEVGGIVVVKPQSANHGRSVFIGLSRREEIEAAYAAARETGQGPNVLVERCVLGCEHRVLVVDGRVAAATRGDPLYITGDGVRSIEAHVAALNQDPRRADDADAPLYAVEFDDMTLGVLARQGYEPASVPAEGERVLIQRNGNLAVDVTAEVHPDNAAIVALAARTVGLDVAGVDLVVEDISKPMREQGGAILEVNAMPGLMMHLKPGVGEPQPVDDIIVASVVPPGSNARIPVVAVNGAGAAEIARGLAARLHTAGLCTGVTCDAGTFVNGVQTRRGGNTSRHAAELLMHPLLEAAVAETPSAAIVDEGLGFEECLVALLASGVEEDPAAQRVLIESVTPGGALVVNATAPVSAEVAALCRGPVVHFSASADGVADLPGSAVYPRNGAIVARQDGVETRLGPLTPGLAPEQVERCVAVSAAAWILQRALPSARS